MDYQYLYFQDIYGGWTANVVWRWNTTLKKMEVSGKNVDIWIDSCCEPSDFTEDEGILEGNLPTWVWEKR